METKFNRPDIYFNLKQSKDINLKVLKAPPIVTSNEKIEYESIEGRRGQYMIKTGTYDNKIVPIQFTLVDFDNFYKNIEEITEWLDNIQDNRLIIGDRNKCYRVNACDFGDIQTELENVGDFIVTFNCEPFLYYNEESKKDITTVNELFNLGNLESEPKVEIWGTGNIQITINDDTFQVNNVDGYVSIDTKKMSCLNINGTDKEMDMIGEWPMLIKGKNIISKLGSISKLVIEPRTIFKN